MAEITAVVFDLDGLIFNTEDVFIEATKRYLAPYGKSYDPNLVPKIMGQPVNVSTSILKNHYGLTASVSEIHTGIDKHFMDVLDVILDFMPGFEPLFEKIACSSLPCAVCTSSSADYAKSLLSRFGYFDKFDVVLGGDQVRRGKPFPDGYLQIAKMLNMLPEQLLVLEDSENGCKAAVAAGAFTVAVPAPHNHGQEYTGVNLIADTLADPRIVEALKIN